MKARRGKNAKFNWKELVERRWSLLTRGKKWEKFVCVEKRGTVGITDRAVTVLSFSVPISPTFAAVACSAPFVPSFCCSFISLSPSSPSSSASPLASTTGNYALLLLLLLLHLMAFNHHLSLFYALQFGAHKLYVAGQCVASDCMCVRVHQYRPELLMVRSTTDDGDGDEDEQRGRSSTTMAQLQFNVHDDDDVRFGDVNRPLPPLTLSSSLSMTNSNWEKYFAGLKAEPLLTASIEPPSFLHFHPHLRAV